ncbi:hypothetical protein M3Y94_00792900 [Aphelenchoides besseyi]|nr:hypothetical protein M3Y94_00792900 [Aphelenchoides besseyi]
MYSGGVDKMGNFIDDDRSVISMVRGCNLLPLGGVDACSESVLPGVRIITCYCYSDYCNSATTTGSSLLLLILSSLLILLLR